MRSTPPWRGCWTSCPDDMIFHPIHYLSLIERKINAFNRAAPLTGWDLPEEFQTLRRLMEERMLKMRRRQFVQVLRLLKTFGPDNLHAAVSTRQLRKPQCRKSAQAAQLT